MSYSLQTLRNRNYAPLTVESLDFFDYLDKALKNRKTLLRIFSGREFQRIAILTESFHDNGNSRIRGYAAMDTIDEALRVIGAQYLGNCPDDQPRVDHAPTEETNLLDLWVITGRRIYVSSPDKRNITMTLHNKSNELVHIITQKSFEETYDYALELLDSR